MPELVVKLGDNIVHKYYFDKDIISVGRSRDNDVVIENLSISRNHCRIRLEGNSYILSDLNSANGTFVNGVKMSKTELFDKDVVSIGKHNIEFINTPLSDEQLISDVFGADKTMVLDKTPSICLIVTKGKQKNQEFKITNYETYIGRSTENDISIHDWFVSKRHAKIIRHGSAYFIKDLGSWKGTHINGKVIKECQLNDDDEIQLGSSKLKVKIIKDDELPQITGRVPQELGFDESYSEEKPQENIFVDNPFNTPIINEGPLVKPAPNEDITDKLDDVFGDESDEKEEEEILEEEPVEEDDEEFEEEDEEEQEEIEQAEELAKLDPPDEESNEIQDEELVLHIKRDDDIPDAMKEEFAIAEGEEKIEEIKDEFVDDRNIKITIEPELIEELVAVKQEEKPVEVEIEEVKEVKEAKEQKSKDKKSKKEIKEVREELKEEILEEIENEAAAIVQPSDVAEGDVNEKEVKLWMNALKTGSPAIKKHAAVMLKKITGKDYDI